MTIPTSNVTVDHYRLHRNRFPIYASPGESYNLNEEIFATFGVRDTASTVNKVGKYACIIKAHPNNGFVDLTGTYALTPVGSSSWLADGSSWDGYCANFGAGSGYALNPANSPLDWNGSGDFTVELWYRTIGEGMAATYANRTLLGMPSNGLRVRIDKTGGEAYYIAAFNNGAAVASSNQLATLNPAAVNHLVIQYASGTCRLFLNGNIMATGNVSGMTLYWPGFYLGYPTAAEAMSFKLIELRVARQALYPNSGAGFAAPLASSNRWSYS